MRHKKLTKVILKRLTPFNVRFRRFHFSYKSAVRFDRILLDAPCSATGVIRRHPDIKWLRQEADIAPLVELQAKILTALWVI